MHKESLFGGPLIETKEPIVLQQIPAGAEEYLRARGGKLAYVESVPFYLMICPPGTTLELHVEGEYYIEFPDGEWLLLLEARNRETGQIITTIQIPEEED